MSSASVLLRCLNCGDEVILDQDYDPDDENYRPYVLVHLSNRREWCPNQ